MNATEEGREKRKKENRRRREESEKRKEEEEEIKEDRVGESLSVVRLWRRSGATLV